jgi:phage shock protein PspC (stress-responsive transcriptional regulator)
MNTTTADTAASTDTTTHQETGTLVGPRSLCRPVQGRMLAGVAAGIARYFDVDVTIVRIVIAVLTVLGGAGVPIYLACWLLIPDEGAEQSIASQFARSWPSR